MITRSDWMYYIRKINTGDYTIAFEHSKRKNRTVYIIDILYAEIRATCSYNAYRKYRKYITSLPRKGRNQMH